MLGTYIFRPHESGDAQRLPGHRTSKSVLKLSSLLNLTGNFIIAGSDVNLGSSLASIGPISFLSDRSESLMTDPKSQRNLLILMESVAVLNLNADLAKR
jgi:hypothetical protein